MGAEEFLNIEEEHKQEFSELLQYCLASGRSIRTCIRNMM